MCAVGETLSRAQTEIPGAGSGIEGAERVLQRVFYFAAARRHLGGSCGTEYSGNHELARKRRVTAIPHPVHGHPIPQSVPAAEETAVVGALVIRLDLDLRRSRPRDETSHTQDVG